MADYITLLGAEQVERAAHRMFEAAQQMTAAVNYMAEENARHERMMQEWMERFEAAIRVAAGATHSCTAARDYGSMDYDASKVRHAVEEAFIRGAEWARAEVIREVEALRREYIPFNEDEEDAIHDSGYNAALDAVIAHLRVLSQGGEGEA